MTYTELYKALNLRSNLFDYHLGKLLGKGLVEKRSKYKLTSLGQSLVTYLDIEKQPIVAVVLAIFNEGKIVLIKREKHAFKDHWALPGGKIQFGETVEESVERICKKETGLQLKHAKYLSTIQELVKEKQSNKHHFILLLYKVKASGVLQKGKLFPLDKLPKKLIPSDAKMLHFTKIKLATSIISESNNKMRQEFFD